MVPISSDPISFTNSGEEIALSSDITYAIYNVKHKRWLRFDSGHDRNCRISDYSTSSLESEEGDKKAMYNFIEHSSGNWILKNLYDDNIYFYYKNRDPALTESYKSSTWDVDYFPLKFKKLSHVTSPFKNNYPVVQILAYDDNNDYYVYWDENKNGADIPKLHSTIEDPNGEDDRSWWVFYPLSQPLSCEKIEYEDNNIFSQLESQLDSANSVRYENEAAEEGIYDDVTKEICNTVETTWTRTDSNELTYGFEISYETPETSVGQASAGYNMQWTYSSSYEESKSIIDSECTETNIKITCPARTICERQIINYKPIQDTASIQVTSICDGIKYVSQSQVSVNGFVYTQVIDINTPMDCEYYTNAYGYYGDTENPKLPFCDTCNDGYKCEICRDGYVLLDDICVTGHVCQDLCGGSIKGDGADGVLNEIPWSGGWCYIDDEESDITKYESDECQEALM